MRQVFFTLFILFFSFSASATNYSTPGTGITVTLSDLVANSGGIVSFSNGEYIVSDSVIIAAGDIFSITSNETVRFGAASLLIVNGNMITSAPGNILFTAIDAGAGFPGIRFDASPASVISNLTFEYASTMRFSDCSPSLNNCTLRFNTSSSAFGSSAITLFRAKPVISNCVFTQNFRAAISGGANIANAPVITGCLFNANNSMNLNVPQINLGASGADTVKIIGNDIIGANTNSGGIGFLPLGTLYVQITGNLIKGNRYGINLQGGADINALVSYNGIEDNNIQNNPNLGGSGIAFAGGSAASQQNSIVTGNILKNNLWGITIQNRARPNLGNLMNADTTDDGKNQFINNTNAGTPGIDLYNNTVDGIFAMGNYWFTDVEAEVEGKIFHQPDNASLGLVTYSSFLLPVSLTQFNAQQAGKDVLLQWQTASEHNSSLFEVQYCPDAIHYENAGSINAAGNSNSNKNYQFTYVRAAGFGSRLYYRLRMVDADAHAAFSGVKAVDIKGAGAGVSLYPTVLSAGSLMQFNVTPGMAQPVILRFFNVEGKAIFTVEVQLQTGQASLSLPVPAGLPKGLLYITWSSSRWQQTLKIIHQ